MAVDIICGDALEVLRAMPDESVHCCVTSPPYYGLRSYGGDDGMIGMERTIEDHLDNLVRLFAEVRRVLRSDGTLWLNYGDAYYGGSRGAAPSDAGRGETYGSKYQQSNKGSLGIQAAPNRMPQSGLKPNDLMGMPWRVAFALRQDGWYLRQDIVWAKPNPMPESVRDRPTRAHEYIFLFSKSGDTKFWCHPDGRGARSKPAPDYRWINKDTDEVTDAEPSDPAGWRRVNLWRGSNYFFDSVAVKTPLKGTEHDTMESRKARARPDQKSMMTEERRGIRPAKEKRPPSGWATAETYNDNDPRYRKRTTLSKRLDQTRFDEQTGGDKDSKEGNRSHRKVLENLKRKHDRGEIDGANMRSVVSAPERGTTPYHDQYDTNHKSLDDAPRGEGANMRSVLQVPTQGYKGAHFATFPPALIEPFIKAGTSERGVCPSCGAPWQRLETADWQQTCACPPADPVPAVVLDPFSGAGTTGLVADRLQRDAILVEINSSYCDLARDRIYGEAPLLAQVS